ncbi:MAG: NAD(P)H-binding protein [Ilumatobacteraceae bacterium]
MRVLVAGGSGFVGSHLVTRLAGEGHEVVVMTRRPESLPSDASSGVRQVFGDVSEPASLRAALDGMDAAYYLVHALDREDFEERDRDGARAFARAAVAGGVTRIVYLGGLGQDGDTLSAHLRSRRDVEKILLAEGPTTALRAGIVVGDGSVSWEILCQLVERLPIMITPRWVQTETQPVALHDVVTYLAAVLDLNVTGEHFDVGAPESMSYREMLEVAAHEMGRRLHIFPVPLLTPALSSHWLRLITDVDLRTARSLVDSMTNEVVVTERRLEALSGHHPMRFVDAARIAIGDRRARKADTAGEGSAAA